MTTPTASQANAAAPKKRRKVLLIIASIFILAGLGFGLYWALVLRFVEETENAYVQGNVVQVTSQVVGTVTRIHADDTNSVKPGDPLVSLDTADADIALAQAEAQLAQTVREVRTLFASQAQAEANLGMREAELLRAQDDLSRRKSLAGSGAVSAEEIRHAEVAVTAAKAAVAVAREQLESGRVLIQGTTVARHPNVLRAASRVQEAMLARSRTTLYAPVGGEIAKRSVQVGQRINPGAPLMAIVPLNQVWIDANFKESQLRDMRIGQPVSLTADLYGGKVVYSGKVAGLAAGTGSAFALLPAQNASGNWIKVVQRVPVRIALDPEQLAKHPLRVGLSMTASVDLHDQSGAPLGENLKLASAMSAYSAGDNAKDGNVQARIDSIINANLK